MIVDEANGITRLCIRDGACVEVCLVECIIPGPSKTLDEWPFFYIDPDTCIDCSACVPECPVEAIFLEEVLPEEYTNDAFLNAAFFTDGPRYWKFDLEEERLRE